MSKQTLVFIFWMALILIGIGVCAYLRGKPRAGECYKDADGFSVKVLERDYDGTYFKWTDEGFNSTIFTRSYETDGAFKQKFVKSECPGK